MKGIPIVYIYFGTIPEYMIRSIECAYKRNKDIVVLTDTDFKHKNAKSYNISKYKKNLEEFEAVYKHMCTNTYEFEKMCIERWFVLRNFLSEEKIDVCYYTDSDVMIYDNLTKLYENHTEYDPAFTITESQEEYRWATSACCSYWKATTLNRFCNYILETYSTEKIKMLEEKWAYNCNNTITGGICDMTLLYLFSKEINFYSLSKEKNGIAFEHNICTSENYFSNEYEMKNLGSRMIKKITWKNRQPFENNKFLSEQIWSIALTEYAKLIPDASTLFKRGIMKIKTLVKDQKHNLAFHNFSK